MTERKEEITLCVPTYNSKKYILNFIMRILPSIREGQNYVITEVIFLDGGSTDGTVELIKRAQRYIAHNNLKIRVFYNLKPIGLARQACLWHSSNKFIIQCNVDILKVDKEYIELLVRSTKKERVALSMGIQLLKSRNIILELLENIHRIIWYTTIINLKLNAMLPQSLMHGHMGFTLIDKEKVHRKQITFNTSLSASEDVEFVREILRSSYDVEIIPKAFYVYEEGNVFHIILKKIRYKLVRMYLTRGKHGTKNRIVDKNSSAKILIMGNYFRQAFKLLVRGHLKIIWGVLYFLLYNLIVVIVTAIGKRCLHFDRQDYPCIYFSRMLTSRHIRN